MTAEADAQRQASPADSTWRVLANGILAYRLPNKKGKPIWLDVMNGVKVCEHGASAVQIHHWRCAARPRPKPEWVTCRCSDAKGLTTKAKLSLEAAVPAYHEVLWGQAQPQLLQPKGVWAVPVPGKPQGRDVFLDAEGKALCPHGYSASELRNRRTRERADAASKIQLWWRGLTDTARTAVRAELLRHMSPASAAVEASDELRRAAVMWRTQSERRRTGEPRGKARPGPAPKPVAVCRCTTAGLRLERFECERCERPSNAGKRKRVETAATAGPLIEITGGENRPTDADGDA